MKNKMTTGETRGLIAAAIVMAFGVLAAAWSSGRFSQSDEAADASCIDVESTTDGVLTDSIELVTVNRREESRSDTGTRKKRHTPHSRKIYGQRSPLDEPVWSE